MHSAAREILISKELRNIKQLWSASYSASVVYTKNIVHLSVGESGGYFVRTRF